MEPSLRRRRHVSRGAPAGATLSAAAAAGAAARRLANTGGRAVGDDLASEPDPVDEETVKIASIVTPAPPSPHPNVTLAAPLAKAHQANVPITAYAFFRASPVMIDTRLPTAALPASIVDNRIGHGTAPITPTRTDPTPGSGAMPSQAPEPGRPRSAGGDARAAPICGEMIYQQTGLQSSRPVR